MIVYVIIVSIIQSLRVRVDSRFNLHTPGGIARPQIVAPEEGTTRGNLPGAP